MQETPCSPLAQEEVQTGPARLCSQEGVYPDTLSQGAPQSTAGALPDEEGVRFKRLIRRCFVCLDMLSHPMLRMMKASAGAGMQLQAAHGVLVLPWMPPHDPQGGG